MMQKDELKEAIVPIRWIQKTYFYLKISTNMYYSDELGDMNMDTFVNSLWIPYHLTCKLRVWIWIFMLLNPSLATLFWLRMYENIPRHSVVIKRTKQIPCKLLNGGRYDNFTIYKWSLKSTTDWKVNGLAGRGRCLITGQRKLSQP